MSEYRLNLDQLLRYGASGGYGTAVLLIAFPEVQNTLFHEDKSAAPSDILLIVFAFLWGTITYAVHRALFFRIVYFYCRQVAGIVKSVEAIDIDRWRRRNNPDSFEKYMAEWAGQIHLLYTCSLTGATAIMIGLHSSAQQGVLFPVAVSITALLFSAGVYTNIMYLIRVRTH